MYARILGPIVTTVSQIADQCVIQQREETMRTAPWD